MKKFTTLFCTVLFASISALTFAGNKAEVIIPGQDPSKKPFVMTKGLVDGEDYLSKTIIFRVKTDFRQNCKVNSVDNILPVQDFLNSIGAQNLAKIYPKHEQPSTERNVLGQKLIDLSLLYSFKYAADMKLEKVINQLKSFGYFEYVEPWYVPKICFAPNDPSWSANQYHLKGNTTGSINTQTAWDTQKGNSAVIIGIVDTGTEPTHPDLAANYAGGYDVAMNDPDPTWQGSSHGVMVSGDACAVTNNSVGVASPGFNCKFKCAKVANASGTLVATDAGITWAADNGCKIINCSFGGPGGGSYGQNIIDYAAINKNCLVIASAGNDGVDQQFYPSSYNNVYRCASTTSTDAKSGFSTYGNDVDFCAPGSNIYSTASGGTYGPSSGTSMSSPVSAGAAGLVQSQFSYTNAFQIGERLKQTCDPLTSALFTQGKLGKGRIDVGNAVSTSVTAKSLMMNPITITDGNDNIFMPGETLNITGTFINYLDPSGSSSAAVLSIVSGPGTITNGNFTVGALATLATTNNNSSPFTVSINGSAAVNSVIKFKVTITDGTFTGSQYFDVTVNPDYINIAINDVFTTITSKGRIGYNQDGQKEGLGFSYQLPSAENLLYEMSLMIGASSAKVSDMFRGGNTGDTDFGSLTRAYIVNPVSFSDFDVAGEFNDAPSPSPVPVEVRHQAYAWNTSPYRKFIIVKYVIKNTGASALSSLYAGLMADWDVTQSGQNKAAYDAANKMGYVYMLGAGGKYAAFKLLSGGGVTHYVVDLVNGGNGGVDPNQGTPAFDTQEKYTVLSTNRNADGYGAGGGDVMDCVSNGPLNINAGDSVVVAFAIIAGDNLADIQNSACYAQQKWDNTGPCAVLAATTTSSNVSCYGQCNGTATANVSGGISPYSYLWNNAQTTQTATGLCAGAYTITVTDATSATTTATVTITQPSVLSVTATSPLSVCSGNCTTLTANATGGNGGNNYVWQPGNMTTTSVSVCPTALTDYTFTVTDSKGCTDATTTTVTVNPAQATPTITASGSTTFCQGSDVTLTSGSGNGYSWSTGATTQNITVSTSGSYSVTVTNANGCSATSTTTPVTVLSATASIIPSGATTFCQGNSVTLTANAGGSSYVWSTNATTQSIVVNQSGSFSVAVTNPCGAYTSSPVSVTVNPLPVVLLSLNPDTLCINAGTYALTGGSPGGGTYSGTGVSAGNFNPNTAGSGLHNIIYTYTDGNNCSNSDTAQIYVDLCTGIQTVSGIQSISISPNPTNGILEIQYSEKISSIEIVNLLGEKIYSSQINSAQTEINLSKEPNGIYFIHLVSEKAGKAIMTKKFAVVK